MQDISSCVSLDKTSITRGSCSMVWLMRKSPREKSVDISWKRYETILKALSVDVILAKLASTEVHELRYLLSQLRRWSPKDEQVMVLMTIWLQLMFILLSIGNWGSGEQSDRTLVQWMAGKSLSQTEILCYALGQYWTHHSTDVAETWGMWIVSKVGFPSAKWKEWVGRSLVSWQRGGADTIRCD